MVIKLSFEKERKVRAWIKLQVGALKYSISWSGTVYGPG
jgi:hypothetical protein